MIIGLSILLFISICLCFYFIAASKKTAVVNEEIKQENDKLIDQKHNLQKDIEILENDISSLSNKYDDLQKNIKVQSTTLQSLTLTAEKAIEGAEQRVQDYYDSRKKELEGQLNKDYEAQAAAIKSQISSLVQKKNEQEAILKDIENKQLAYLEAEQRKKEMEANQDYYRLQLSPEDINDVQILRDIEYKIGKKDAIDKIIYKVYYRPAYNALVARLMSKDKVCGIYRITSIINGMSYIGQSVKYRPVKNFSQQLLGVA